MDGGKNGLTLRELWDQLPVLGIADSIEMTAIHPSGKEFSATVSYSSDLGAMAIIQYEADGNIRSLLPLPTSVARSMMPGIGTCRIELHEWPDHQAPDIDIHFRINTN